MRKSPRRLHARGRPAPPPPPITRSPGEPFLPHAVVLDENEPEAAVVLWLILQDVTLWSMIPAEQRGPELFNDEAGEVGEAIPDLRLDLSTLRVLVRDSHADAAPIIASVCQRVATWAEEKGRTGTALCFFQAAALADRTDPRYAHGVAKQARRKADFARATAWYQRAVVLARRAGDWETEARSYSGLGILQWQVGNRARAIELQERVIRIARRYHLREVRADALFDLAVLNYEVGRPESGLAAAEQALRLYGPGHRQIPLLAQNVAVCWMDYGSRFREALSVLRELLPLVSRPAERVRLVANLARAAAGAGERALFETAWAEALARMADDSGEENNADALLVLARGAVLLGDHERVQLACERALLLARSRGEEGVFSEAERLWAEARSSEASGDTELTEDGAADHSDEADTADRLLAALRAFERPVDELSTALSAVFGDPGNPAPAYELALVFRSRSEFAQSFAWFEWAYALAERSEAREIGVRCLVALANLQWQRGDVAGAVAIHERARQIAHEYGFREVEGATLHDLCVIHFEEQLASAGFAFAREAITAYETGHPRIARLAHDVAVFMMQARGDYTNALHVFRELECHITRPADQLVVLGNEARAAAGAGEMLLFDGAWEQARTLIDQMGDNQENHATAMINLAHGALTAGRMAWAEAVASRAREIAVARGEDHVLPSVDELLSAIEVAKQTRVRHRPFSDPTHDMKDAGRLSRQLVSALRARGSQTRRPRAPASERRGS